MYRALEVVKEGGGSSTRLREVFREPGSRGTRRVVHHSILVSIIRLSKCEEPTGGSFRVRSGTQGNQGQGRGEQRRIGKGGDRWGWRRGWPSSGGKRRDQ